MSGALLSAADAGRLRAHQLPPALEKLLCAQPLIGLSLTLEEEDDDSEMGAEIQIMDADQMLSEATEVYPGMIAVKQGYWPFGICLEGTGDPYFFRARDGAIVRIPHDAVDEDDELDEDEIEVVAPSIDALLERASQ